MSSIVAEGDLSSHLLPFDAESLKKDGWSRFDLPISTRDQFRARLEEIGRRIGIPVPVRSGGPVCQALTPRTAEAAPLRSLSRLHATGEFPLHTDTAHWPTPCRYLLLACFSPGAGRRPTFLLDAGVLPFSSAERQRLESASCRIHNGRASFFSTILAPGRSFVRLDAGCMVPLLPDGPRLFELFSPERWRNRVEVQTWRPGLVLVLDNWRMLHGRGPSEAPDSDRELYRISIL